MLIEPCANGWPRSLETIASELPSAIAARLARGAAAIRSGPVSPLVFARYFEVVRAIAAASASRISSAIEALAAEVDKGLPGHRVLDLDDRDLGSGGGAVVAQVIDDDDGQLAPGPVGSDVVAVFQDRLDHALDLIGQADPALAGEIEVFGRTIILARSTRPGGGFGGASSPFLWGGLVLNPARRVDRVALAEALAHETAHALLFGLAEGQPLTTNGRTERYASPLRADPRPIEGIVHATFVLARMSHCLQQLLGSGALAPAERDAAARQIRLNTARFVDGLATVDAHALLTDQGRAIIDECRIAMDRPQRALVSAP